MRRNILALLRTFVFAAFVPALAFSLVACEPENGGGTVDGGGNGDEEDTTSEIAVTGLVDKFGCTYADISGYANLNLLPAGSGNPVIGVEVVEAKAEGNDNAVRSTSSSLTGNIFTASFSDLSPATEYKYRSFVTYGGITYYGNKYNTFTTKEVVGIASTGEVSEITRKSAVLSASVQAEGVDARDNVSVGLAWSADKDAIRADGSFESRQISVQNVEDGVFSATLSGLSGSTTYYYASFTLVGGVYVFSSVKSFTTEDIPEGAVDLGLSVLWASCNVGASVPEGNGGYYAWGETEEKSNYTPLTYKYYLGDLNGDGDYYDSNEYQNIGSNISGTSYDVAHVKWGGSWRMPTLDEIKELYDECSWQWTEVNGVKGQKVTGPNGNSIFLPAAGYRYRMGEGIDRGYCGRYWSGLYDYSRSAYYLFFLSDYHDWRSYYRYYGYPVRPVTE